MLQLQGGPLSHQASRVAQVVGDSSIPLVLHDNTQFWLILLQAYWVVLMMLGRAQGSLYLNQALAAVVEVPAFLLTLLLLDRAGRRPVFSFALLQGQDLS